MADTESTTPPEAPAVSEVWSRATGYVTDEVKKHPYATVATAFSFGYLFGQGWIRALTRVGFAYFANEIARQGYRKMSTAPIKQTLH